MPTILRAGGLSFVIYVDDHPPPHVHVRGDGDAKIAIDEATPRVMFERGLSKADVRRALIVVEREWDMLLTAWKRIHG